MKLDLTPGSPYARVSRIIVLEKRLEGRVEFVVAQTRSADSKFYRRLRTWCRYQAAGSRYWLWRVIC